MVRLLPLIDSAPMRPLPAASPPRRRWPRIVRETLAVVAITLMFTLALLEIGLRLFASQIQVPVSRALFVNDPAARFRNLPGARIEHDTPEFQVLYTINNQGLRAGADTGALSPGRLRLLCVGDSFTFGWGVQEQQAFPLLLNNNKGADSRPVESLNAGVAGYGTNDEVAWLHKFGWSLQPKIVLLGFFAGNDVVDVMRRMNKAPVETPADQAVIDAVDKAKEREHTRSGMETWLLGNSHAYVFLNKFFGRFLASRDARKPDVFDTAYNYLRSKPPELSTGWKKTTELLSEIEWKAREHNARLVVVVIPAAEQVEERFWSDIERPLGLTDADLNRDLPQQEMAAWGARAGIPIIDLLPDFRAAHGQRLYYNGDPHWTPAGHALAAQIISRQMTALGLFSP